jgi:hypothetical protein
MCSKKQFKENFDELFPKKGKISHIFAILVFADEIGNSDSVYLHLTFQTSGIIEKSLNKLS